MKLNPILVLLIFFSLNCFSKDQSIVGSWIINDCNGTNINANEFTYQNTVRNNFGNQYVFMENGIFEFTSDSTGSKIPYKKYGNWELIDNVLTLSTDSLKWYHARRNNFYPVSGECFNFLKDTLNFRIKSQSNKKLELIQIHPNYELYLNLGKKKKINLSWNVPEVQISNNVNFRLHKWRKSGSKHQIILEFYAVNNTIDTITMCMPRYNSSFISRPEFFSINFKYNEDTKCLYEEKLTGKSKNARYFVQIPPSDSIIMHVNSEDWFANHCNNELSEFEITINYEFDYGLLYYGNFIRQYLDSDKAASFICEDLFRKLEQTYPYKLEHKETIVKN